MTAETTTSSASSSASSPATTMTANPVATAPQALSSGAVSSAEGTALAPPPPMGAGDMLMSFMPIIMIFVIFYFLLIRPQQKRLKEHQAMIDALQKGDKVITGGGILGHITKVGPGDEVTIEISEGVRVRVLRSTLTGKEPDAAAAKAQKPTSTTQEPNGKAA